MMASAPIRLGLRFAGGKNVSPATKIILASKFGKLEVLTAGITSRSNMIGERPPKPKPWPYEEKGYSNWRFWTEKTMKRFDENTRVIFVEGPPAIGKTAFAKSIAEEFEMKYFPMPTMDYFYINHYGVDIRDYDDKVPYGFKACDELTFIKNPHHQNAPSLGLSQFKIKYEQYIDALMHLFNTGQGVVLERSAYTQKAFLDASLKLGYINKAERAGFDKHCDEHMQDLLRPHLVIYLDASIDTVLSNFKKRGLGEEKTFNYDYLQTWEDTMKRLILPQMEKHAELLVFDWNTPGDMDIAIYDIERLNFEKFFENYTWRDEKMKDWRFEKDEDACEKRWWYTHKKQFLCAFTTHVLDCPRYYWEGQEVEQFEEMTVDHLPGYKYEPGWDPKIDKVFFKDNRFRPLLLPSIVTEQLLKRTKHFAA